MVERFAADLYPFSSILEDENNEQEFFRDFESSLGKLSQQLVTKIEAIQQKIQTTKEKCMTLKSHEKKRNKVKTEIESSIKEIEKSIDLKQENLNSLNKVLEDLRNGNAKLKEELKELGNEKQKKCTDVKNEWIAITTACNLYKKYLNIHLKTDDQDITQVKITLFLRENPDKDNYYVILLKKNEKWRINEIKPELNNGDQEELSNLPLEMDNLHVTLLLSMLWKIFPKYKT